MADATGSKYGEFDVNDVEGPWPADHPIITAHKYAVVMTDISPTGIVEVSEGQWFDTPAAMDEYFDEVTAELKDEFLNEYSDFNVIVFTKVKTEAMNKHISYRVVNKPEQMELAKSIRKRLGTKRVGDLYTIGANLFLSEAESDEAIKVHAKNAADDKAKAEQLAEVKPKTASKNKVVKGGDSSQPEPTTKPKVVSKGKRRDNGPVIEPVVDSKKPSIRSKNKQRPTGPIQQVNLPNSQFSKNKRRPQAS